MRKLMLIAIGLVSSLVLCIYLMKMNYCIFLVPLCLILMGVFVLLSKKISFWKMPFVVLIGCVLGALVLLIFEKVYLEPIEKLDGKVISTSVTASDYSRQMSYRKSVDGRINIEGKEYSVLVYYSAVTDLAPGDQIIRAMVYLSLRMQMMTYYVKQPALFH